MLYFQTGLVTTVLDKEKTEMDNVIVGNKKPILNYGFQNSTIITTPDGGPSSKLTFKISSSGLETKTCLLNQGLPIVDPHIFQ